MAGVVFLIFSACTDDSAVPSSNGGDEPTVVETSQQDQPRGRVATYDDRLARIGRDFPGFAGVELDQKRGRLLIYMTKRPSNTEELARRVRRSFGDDLRRFEPKIVLQTYSFRQLRRWYDRFYSSVFRFKGVTMSDINETTNTIDIGVSNLERYAPPIYRAAKRAGIPRRVVRVVHQLPFRQLKGADDA